MLFIDAISSKAVGQKSQTPVHEWIGWTQETRKGQNALKEAIDQGWLILSTFSFGALRCLSFQQLFCIIICVVQVIYPTHFAVLKHLFC